MQVRAAYSVHDVRAVLPGHTSTAAAAPDPVAMNERRVIGDGPHVLTRQALSHWASWRSASEMGRKAIQRNVGEGVTAALAQLERNVIELGPRSEWFDLSSSTSRWSMKAGLPQRLMFGLVMDARVLPALLRMLDLHSAKEALLEKALRALERVETLNRPVAPVAAVPQVPDNKRTEVEDMSAMRQRVQKALEERKIDLREPVPEATKRAIADALGVHSSTVNRYVVDLRQAAGITVAAMPAGETIFDRLREQIKARQIDIERDVPMATQEALAITLNTTKATVNNYLARLRAEARKAAETPVMKEFPEEQPTVTSAPVEAPVQYKPEPEPDVRRGLNHTDYDPIASSDHDLRAELDTMRSQLQALTSGRDRLREDVKEWQETAQENERQRLRWMNQALDLRREFEEFRAQQNGAMVRQDAPTVLPVATVPQAITSAEVRELAGYEALGADIGRLVTAKQQQYGDSFGRSGDVLRQFYPDGIRPEQMDDALAVVRITDKLFRIAAGNQGEENAWRDVAGYGLLGAAKGVSN